MSALLALTLLLAAGDSYVTALEGGSTASYANDARLAWFASKPQLVSVDPRRAPAPSGWCSLTRASSAAAARRRCGDAWRDDRRR